MFKILSILIFFPSITFGVYSSEIFPWGIIFAIFYMRHINKYLLWILIILCLSTCLVLFHSFISLQPVQTDILRSLAAYMNFLLLAQAFLMLSTKKVIYIISLSRKIFWFLIILGLIQNIGSDSLGYIIQSLIPRGAGSALTEINRGVTLLSTEPARAGIELMLIYLIHRIRQDNSIRNTLIDIFLLMYLAVIIKSFSVVVFALSAFAIIHVKFRFHFLSILGSILLGIVGIYFIINILPQIGGRAGDVVIFLQDIEAINDGLFYIANESGNRIIGLYSFYKFGIFHPFGFGVGSWPYASIQAINESGFDYRDFRFFDVVGNGQIIPFRGAGIISNLMLDVGLLGTLLLTYLFKKLMLFYGSFNKLSVKAFWIFLIKIAFFGSPGNPIVFIFFITVFLCASEHFKEKATYRNVSFSNK